jgi:hypothetical protein
MILTVDCSSKELIYHTDTMNIPVSSPLIVATQPKPPPSIQTVSAVSLTNSSNANSLQASSANSAIILSINSSGENSNVKPPTLTLTSGTGVSNPIEAMANHNGAFMKPTLVGERDNDPR